MRGLYVRFVSVALCATAVTGCSALSGDNDRSNLASETPAETSTAPLDIASSVQQAQDLRTKGDLNGAMRILSQLMLAAPDDSRIVGEYGKLLVQQGRIGDAVQFLNRAIQLQPSDWTYYSALGVAYDQMGDRSDARLAYEHALTLKPNEPAVLNNYAMSRMLAGDTAAARALMARAQATGSTDPKIAANLELLNHMPNPAAPAPTAARAPTAPAAAPTARTAKAAPQPLAGGAHVVMQAVPADPLAGPVHGKPVKTAKVDKKAKPAKDQIPALRMTADAGKP
ncbi:MAG TPA: tetratricopeptide repeat protein [Rhizomicrobium sp.]|nr:tetratricopeptide repeat protein [Rhizomicrobium sp.]